MREEGASEEDIEQWREASLANLDTHEDPEPPFEVWPENALPLRLLQLAHFDVALGMHGMVHTGVSTPELLALMDAFEVPPGEPRRELLELLRYVIPSLCNARNERTE